jgi:hypothetical protein
MTGTNGKNLWSWRLISPSLALSTSCQSSSQITAPVHSPSVNSPSIYWPHPHTVFIYLAPLHPSISTCTSTIPVFNCNIVITSPPWPIYCLNSLILPHLHSLYIDFLSSFVLLYHWLCFVYSMCKSVVVCLELLCFILARSQLQMRTCSQLAYLVK